MKSRNDRDRTRHRPVRLTAQERVEESRLVDARHGSAMWNVWRWSRMQLARASVLVRKLMHRQQHCLHFCSGSRCVKGPVREVNEDRCYADQHRGLFIVADGMGGHAGGERASQTVIEVIASQLSDLLDNDYTSQTDLSEAMLEAILVANQELIDCARVDVSLSGMGATVVLGVVRHNHLLLCSVGDSRAYLQRQDEMQQLTVDDTLVQGLVSAGALTVVEAAKHPMRHVLLHSVGTRRFDKQVRVESLRLRPGDRLLFATDGLTDAVDRDELVVLLAGHADPQGAAMVLSEHAQEAGSRDNITCIVVDLFR